MAEDSVPGPATFARISWAAWFVAGLGGAMLALCWLSPIDNAVPLVTGAVLLNSGCTSLLVTTCARSGSSRS